MTDLTCEFFKRIIDDSATIPRLQRSQPHEAEIQQLYAVVQNLDKVTPRATRSPDCLLRGWIRGICGACVPDSVSSNFDRLTSKRLREGVGTHDSRRHRRNRLPSDTSLVDGSKKSARYIEEIKAVIEVIYKAVEDTNDRLERRAAIKRKCLEAQESISWKKLLFGGSMADEELSMRDQKNHIRGMSEVLNAFLTDLKDLIKLHEISLLKAEVTEQEILSGWSDYKSCLQARKENEIEAAAHYATAVNMLTRKLEDYLNRSTELTSDFSPSPKDESGNSQLSFDSPPTPNSAIRIRQSQRLDSEDMLAIAHPADLPPEEVELIAQTNPKIQELHCLQERDSLEEESVIEITRKVERISELLSVLATEVDNQHSISSNILVVTNAAIANVSSAQSELEKAMQRKISWRRILFLVYLASGVLLIMIDLLRGGGF